MIEIRWHGRGGQGAFTASKILGAAAVLEGKQALAFPSFGPERRGAPIQAFTKISDSKIVDRTVITKCDYIIYLDDTLYEENARHGLKEGGKILINTKNPEKYDPAYITAIDATGISDEIIHKRISNTPMLSALVSSFHIIENKKVKTALEFFFPKKVADQNKQIVDYVSELINRGKEV